MNRNRKIYLALLISSFLFIYFYGGKIPYMLFFVVLTLPLVSLLYTTVIFLRFKFTQEVDKKTIIKGEKVNFLINIINEDIFLYPYIRVNFYGTDTFFANQFHSKCFSLKPFKKTTFAFELECNYRGQYPIGIKSFDIEDLLGIFKLTYNFNENKEITVYPKIVFLDKFLLKANYLSDSHTILNNNIEDMSTISSIRKYTHGDGYKRIHWKISAKMNELFVKNFQSTSQTNAIMYLDLKKNNMPFDYKTIVEDKVIECAVAVTYYCLMNWIPLDFVYYSSGIVNMEAKNPLDFEDIYKTLSKISFTENIALKDMLEIHLANNIKKTNIVIFTSNVNYDLYNELYRINSSGYQISLIYVSPQDLTGEVNEEADNVLSFLPEIGVNIYKVNINDNIKQVLER
ncbi:MAG: DUF58 domain-containing protein [Clostridia bacterium]|nr:DUF58 domain-containing protein [Clostridia bacterium]